MPGITDKRVTDDHEALYSFIAPHMKGKIVFDAACGAGRFSHDMAVYGAKVVAVDNNQGIIDHAYRMKEHPNVVYLVRDLNQYQPGECKYDAVTCINAIEHFQDVKMLLKKFLIAVVPGGELWISSIDRKVRRNDAYLNPHHPSEMTCNELCELLTNTGFRIETRYGQRPVILWRTRRNFFNKVMNKVIGRPEATASFRVQPWKPNMRYFLIRAIKPKS